MKTATHALSRARVASLPRNALATALATTTCVIALAANITSSHARISPSYPLTSLGSSMRVAVVDRTSGQILPVYQYRGEYWVAGVPGNKYAVSISNPSDERILTVVSVDGVNVLSGETASTSQRGYVFHPKSTYQVAGWRKSDLEVAAFTFASSPQSYAARTGRPSNVGTIGVAMFRERWVAPPQVESPAPREDWRYRQDAPQSKLGGSANSPLPLPAPSAAPVPQARDATESTRNEVAKRGSFAERAAPSRVEESLGTAHGAREYDRVSRTEFERLSDTPSEVIRIRYDSFANLVALGVIPEPRRPHDRSPNPFPDAYGNNSYVPDPPRWFR
ncbi:MAG: hypothetical protein EAZ21_05335 [Betaproteobacteria bacterium]|nr:MAG: hypothetical protein EAZ21_05335 [Betaproteobacteria bacterium]